MAIRLNSEASCREAYIDYYTNKNTKVTAEDMRRIVQRYSEAIRKTWQEAITRASNDENRYEFDDDQFEDIRLESYEETEEEYGEDVNVKTEKNRTAVDGITTGVGAVSIAGATGLTSLGKIIPKLGEFLAGNFEDGFFKGGTKGGLIGYILSGISCLFSFVTGLMAKTNKANEEEINAVNDLVGEMENQQEVVAEQQDELETLEKQIQNASDQATTENQEANDDINTLAGQHVALTGSYQILQNKIDRGEKLSSSEAMQYSGLVKLMNSTSAQVKTRSEQASETLNENLETISAFNSDYDMVATNIANVQGVTDYASEIDEVTQKNCANQAKIQSLNSYTAYAAAAGMAVATATFAAQVGFWPAGVIVIAVGAVLTGLAVLGGVWSGKAAKEQAQFAQQAANEVALRVNVQEGNEVAQENLDAGIDNYNNSKAAIEVSTINEPINLPKVTQSNPFVVTSNNDDNNDGKPEYLT